ncbi:MAG: hypothetical protein M3Z05_22430 [Gemmatimonadota bacterium]|nr:hypothetical protein [Gemmatimonadota bacterium]
MSYKRIAIVAALALLSACGSDSVTNTVNDATSGSLSFNYTGGGGGSFSATGAITSAALASSPYTTTWAAGFKDATDNSTNMAANITRTATTSDVAVISVKGQATGTFSIDVNCVATGTSTCNDVVFITGQSASGQTFNNACTLTAGSIMISALTSTRATGTFSGSGTCASSTGVETAWVVTNGAFSVPLLANAPSSLP